MVSLRAGQRAAVLALRALVVPPATRNRALTRTMQQAPSERPADTHGATPFSSPAKGQKIVGGTWSLDAPYSAMRVSIVLSCAGSDSERSFVLRRRRTQTRARRSRQRQWWFALERIVDDVEELDLARRVLGCHVPALHKHLPLADA